MAKGIGNWLSGHLCPGTLCVPHTQITYHKALSNRVAIESRRCCTIMNPDKSGNSCVKGLDCNTLSWLHDNFIPSFFLYKVWIGWREENRVRQTRTLVFKTRPYAPQNYSIWSHSLLLKLSKCFKNVFCCNSLNIFLANTCSNFCNWCVFWRMIA